MASLIFLKGLYRYYGLTYTLITAKGINSEIDDFFFLLD